MIPSFLIRLIITAIIFQVILSVIDQVATNAAVDPITTKYKTWIGKLAGCVVFIIIKLLDAIRTLLKLAAILIFEFDAFFSWFENTFLRL